MCKIGSSTLGFNEIPSEATSGASDYKEFKLFNAQRATRRTIDKIPVLPPNSTDAVIYSSLENTSFIPDVAVVICNPKQVMLLTQAYSIRQGAGLKQVL